MTVVSSQAQSWHVTLGRAAVRIYYDFMLFSTDLDLFTNNNNTDNTARIDRAPVMTNKLYLFMCDIMAHCVKRASSGSG